MGICVTFSPQGSFPLVTRLSVFRAKRIRVVPSLVWRGSLREGTRAGVRKLLSPFPKFHSQFLPDQNGGESFRTRPKS